MRGYLKYLLVIFILTVFSCQKQSIIGPDIEYAEDGLVSFSTKVHTKSPVITSLSGKNFGVYGYSFSKLTNWNTAKAKATPNEFHNLIVSGTDCSYSYIGEDALGGYKKWDFSKGYSFFAYYPYFEEYITDSDDVTTGVSRLTDLETPYIDYTLPISGTNPVNPDDMLDIMTAAVKDHNLTLGPVVDFNFYHRLFCIDLKAINHSDDKIVLSDLSMTISGIHYNKTRIYMDRDRVVYDEVQEKEISQPSIPSTVSGWSTKEFEFSPLLNENTLTIQPHSTVASISNNTKLVMLIPQDSSLENAAKLTVKINGSLGEGNNKTSIQEVQGEFDLNFQEGKKYTLTLNFLTDDVILTAAVVDPWDVAEDVYHTFD